MLIIAYGRGEVGYNMGMIIVWAFSWWYGAGWASQLDALKERLSASFDYFSIGLLLRTLFSPYRQISAGTVNGPITLKLQGFADRLVSRIIGAFVRSLIIIIGTIWLMLLFIIGGLLLIVWAFVPFAPLMGFIAMLAGWVPQWT